ncbi:MAG: polynucleotide adenylyltransferase PcnB [Desulfuromonadaceae bacterium]|nr:polynucleotide adenylyltransferase PcnB [Desulfuromonadaceae bacterium]
MTDIATYDPALDPPGEPRIICRDHHRISRSMIDEDVLKILYRLSRNGHLAYLVGGSVRDLLLGRTPKDFDIGTDATPSRIKRLFRNCFLIGRRFRLAHIRFRDNKVVEVATFRRCPAPDEFPEDPGDHLHFAENVFGSPRQDAFRRDFTINALFYDIATFSVIDHVGGLEDLQARRLRVIGDPGTRFREDPVRMLRALEMAARLDFTLDAELTEGLRSCAPLIAAASPSRLRDEVMELFRHGVAAKVLPQAQDFGILPHLLADYFGDRESFALLRRLDERTADGRPVDESLAIATLFLCPFLAAFPPSRESHVVEALHQANETILPHCRHFSIAQGIRQQAREILAGCFRLARGPGLRGEARFLRHPLTSLSLELFSLYALDHPEMAELVLSWQRLMGQTHSPATIPEKEKRPRRRPRRPRSRRPRTAPGAENKEP